MDDLAKEKMVLVEMHLLYRKYDTDADHLDTKASYLLSSSSLIITLFGLLQLTLLKQPQPILYQILLGGLFLLFFLLIGAVLKVLFPKKYKTVFEENWDGVEKSILHQNDEKAAIMQVIGNYLDRIQHNKNINDKKALLLRWATWFFVTQMVLIVFLSLFSLR